MRPRSLAPWLALLLLTLARLSAAQDLSAVLQALEQHNPRLAAQRQHLAALEAEPSGGGAIVSLLERQQRSWLRYAQVTSNLEGRVSPGQLEGSGVDARVGIRVAIPLDDPAPALALARERHQQATAAQSRADKAESARVAYATLRAALFGEAATQYGKLHELAATVAALAAVVSPDREHWLLGELTVEEPLHTPPVVQHYATVHATGRTLRLHYARLADLRPYAHVVVAQGEVLVKQLVPQPPVPSGTAWASSAAPTHAAPSASLPLVQRVPVVATVRSLADVAVRQGDPVRVGQLLATDHSRDADLAATQAQLQAASLPPPPEPGTSLPLQHVVGDPDALLRQGVIDRREYQQILTTRTTLARQEQQRHSRLTELRSKLAALERQQRVLSPVAGRVQQLRLTEQKDAALRVELTLEVPLPASSLAGSGPLALPAAAIPPPQRP